MRVQLLEPNAGGRISGGYLYNQRIAEGLGAVERHALDVNAIEQGLAELDFDEPGLVLIDSLFLTPELAAPFLRLRRPGLQLGVLMHAFPSFIERAGHREQLSQALPLFPTRAELDILAELDLLVAPGPYIPRLLAECGSAIPTLICPPGIDRRPPPSPRAVGESVRLISIGAVTPLKGLADGIQALASVGHSWSWSIVGHVGVASEHVAQLRRMTREHGLEGAVHFTGQRTHEETLAELRQSDLLLLPSHTENCPLVALEALAAAVPVVGYAVGGVPDIIRHGVTGLLAPPLDVGTLAAHLNQLTESAERRQRLSLGCVEAARGLISWEDAARQFQAALVSFLQPLLERR